MWRSLRPFLTLNAFCDFSEFPAPNSPPSCYLLSLTPSISGFVDYSHSHHRMKALCYSFSVSLMLSACRCPRITLGMCFCRQSPQCLFRVAAKSCPLKIFDSPTASLQSREMMPASHSKGKGGKTQAGPQLGPTLSILVSSPSFLVAPDLVLL